MTNLSSKQAWDKTTYFKAYQKSFKEGEYNLSEPIYTPTGQVIRRYMSGGTIFKVMQGAGYTANSPILPGNKALLTGVGVQLNIQPSPEAMAGSPINEQLLKDYWGIIGKINDEINAFHSKPKLTAIF